MKICPEPLSDCLYDISVSFFNYCPYCGRKFWDITQEEFMKAWDFIDKKTMIVDEESRKRWIAWLKSRHPEFR